MMVRFCKSEIVKDQLRCFNEWKKADPSQTYSSWKRELKRRIIRVVYSKMLDRAISYLVRPNPYKLLKTDLWADCLGDTTAKRLSGAFDIYGIDVSLRACAAARWANSGNSAFNVLRADIHNLPFRANTFELVADISTLDHVEPGQAGEVIMEYARVLKTSGVLLLCADSNLSLPWLMYRRTLPYPVWSWSPSHVRRIVAATCLKILRTHFVNTPLDLLDGPMSRLSHSMWSAIFSPLAQYYMIIARKIEKTVTVDVPLNVDHSAMVECLERSRSS